MHDDKRFLEWGDLLPEVTLGALLFSSIMFAIGLYVDENHKLTKYLGRLLLVLLLVILICGREFGHHALGGEVAGCSPPPLTYTFASGTDLAEHNRVGLLNGAHGRT